MLRREGLEVNHKRLFRMYREEKLHVRRRGGRKRAFGTLSPMLVPMGLCCNRVSGHHKLVPLIGIWFADFIRANGPMRRANRPDT